MSENVYGSLSLDKGGYSWTDKVKIRLMVHGFDHKQDTIQISVGDNELKSYKLSKAGNGLYAGEVILIRFSHDVDGDGKPDTNPRTTGSGPNNGFLESNRDENLEVSVRFQDGTKMKTTTKITWNVGEVSFDISNHQLDETAKLQAIDPDMNLNPETLDKLPIHVFSDSDKAGILVDAIETEEESGTFETTISFTQNSASDGNRLFAISGDVIYAQYTDHTLPKPYDIHDDLEILAESTVRYHLIAEPEQDEPIHENYGSGTIFEDGICVVENSKENHDNSVRWSGPAYNHVKPPLKQFKAGVPVDEIQCRESLTLVAKNDGSPACVKEQTLLKLVERKLIITSKTERDLMLAAGYKLYPGVGWVQGEQEKQLSPEPESERDPVPEGNYVDKNTYVNSVNEAESYLNYTLSTPYLPEGTDLEKIKISSDRRKTTIYYSNSLEVSHHPMGINFNNTHYVQNPEQEAGKVFYDFAGTFAEGLEIDNQTGLSIPQ